MKHVVQKMTHSILLSFCLSVGLAPTLSLAEAPTPISSSIEQRVSLNTADAQTLAAKLDGIGQTKAERIVAWREANGRFESAEQLLQVKGIGEVTLKKNLNRITL